MEFIDYLAIAGLLLSGWIFIALTNTDKEQGVDSFFFYSHEASGNKYGASMAAASTSLATVVMFFITGVEQYGVFLLWCGITYFAGQSFLLWFIKTTNINTTTLTTVADFWADESSTKISPKIFSLLSATAFIFMLFLELYVGSQILTYFISESSNIINYLCFLFLLVLVSTYVLKGGMFAVFKSDLWQYNLMVTSIIVLVFCSLIFSLNSDASEITLNNLSSSIEVSELSLFLIWVTIQNLTLPFTQLSSWQRIASIENVESAIKGLKKISFGFLILWLFPVFSLLLLQTYGVQFSNIGEFFNFFKSSDNIVIYFSFAIIFVGFSSALFSTADSAFIACLLSISDKNTFLDRIKARKPKELRKLILIFVICLITIESVLYSIFQSQASSSFLSIVYVIFSQLSLIAPMVITIIYRKLRNLPKLVLSTAQDKIISIGLFLSWVLLFYFNFRGDSYGLNQNLSIIVGSLSGMALSTITLVVSLSMKSKNKLALES